MIESVVAATAVIISAHLMSNIPVLFIIIAPLMDTASDTLNVLNIGADDGRKTANGTEKGKIMTEREKLIDLIRIGRYEAELTCSRNDDCQTCPITDPNGNCKHGCVADHLISNGVTFQKWISVSERLPEHSKIVLCCLTFNELRILQWDSVSKWWLGYGAGDDWRQKDVTHWMPLPEPPKDGERKD